MFGIPEVNIVAPMGVEGEWITAVENAKVVEASAKVIRYTIGVRGNVEGNYEEFRKLVAETLNDSRGWPRAGVRFEEVGNGGAFAIYLQEPALFDNYAGCHHTLSCRSGNNVMINDERWRLGTEHWTGTGLPLVDYQRLIVNHEVGHWLGHRHVDTPCSATSVPMPLMLESSLRGSCKPNIWPLEDELWHQR